jgi:predicted nucleic acid-binding protein
MIPAYHAGYVVDASVAVKWFSPEENRDDAFRLLERYRTGRCRLMVPGWLFFLEVADATKRKADATEESVAEILENLWSYQLELVEIQPRLISKTNAIAYGYRASIYDAAYVALAEVTGFPLVTADEVLLKRMKGHAIVLPVWELEFPQ